MLSAWVWFCQSLWQAARHSLYGNALRKYIYQHTENCITQLTRQALCGRYIQMFDYRFAFTSNAGLSITFPSALIWVDAIHDIKAPTYSTVTPEIYAHMQQDPDYVGADFNGPHAMAFSHCHIDHFTSGIVRDAMKRWPDAKVVLPEKYFPNEVYISGESSDVDINGVELKFVKTHHCTKRHHNKTHYSFLLDDGNINIFMPMDSSMSDPVMHYYAVNTDIDVAVVDYVWVLLQKGRDIIEHDIKPKHLLLYHLPFAEDDRHGFITQTHENAKLMTSIADIRILDTPYQKEVITM